MIIWTLIVLAFSARHIEMHESKMVHKREEQSKNKKLN